MKEENTNHVFATVVADVENLGVETEPIQKAVDLLAYVGLAARGD